MKYIAYILLLLQISVTSVSAMDFQPPPAPDSVAAVVESHSDSFSEGLWNVFQYAMKQWKPRYFQTLQLGIKAFSIVLLGAIARELTDSSGAKAADLAATVCVSLVLLTPSHMMIRLGTATINEMSQYNRLLLPVMTASLAAQGGVNASTALYAGTAFFNSMLSACMYQILVPLLYFFLVLSIVTQVIENDLLQRLKLFFRWSVTWGMKITLYLFTGYMAVTGVVSGTADAAAAKAAKITISGAVPVIGSILSDAAETILVSAGILRNAAGVYGIITLLAILAVPFLTIGIQYIVLCFLGAVCSSFTKSHAASLIEDFASVMGMILGIVSSQSILMLISTVCFMKGGI